LVTSETFLTNTDLFREAGTTPRAFQRWAADKGFMTDEYSQRALMQVDSGDRRKRWKVYDMRAADEYLGRGDDRSPQAGEADGGEDGPGAEAAGPLAELL